MECARPRDDSGVGVYTTLLRRMVSEAVGRDEQWDTMQEVKEAAQRWGEAYPPHELEYMAGEAWNNGIYFHRLASHRTAEGWFSLAHLLAQRLPVCDTRSEIEMQFDVALDQRAP
eukprot:TRINITY_DN39340_c0_g1_i1.p2 TRINITY_DN39340_c0_g1~~TRINITY_DN39340_c0_g1_i1.p2  ORF type:complete len:123 (+),score=43.10 TRINITY_DN39340_c0_g1_i1:27-371(+)